MERFLRRALEGLVCEIGLRLLGVARTIKWAIWRCATATDNGVAVTFIFVPLSKHHWYMFTFQAGAGLGSLLDLWSMT